MERASSRCSLRYFCDVEGEQWIPRHQAVKIVRTRRAQQRVFQASRKRRADDVGEDDLFAEQVTGPENRDGDFFAVLGRSCDSDSADLHDIDQSADVALLEDNRSFGIGDLREQVFVAGDYVVGRAFEES